MGLGNVPWAPRLQEAITLTTELHPLLTALQLSVGLLLTQTHSASLVLTSLPILMAIVASPGEAGTFAVNSQHQGPSSVRAC